MLAGKLRYDSPDVLIGGFESIAQRLDRRRPNRRAVDQRDHGGVAARLSTSCRPICSELNWPRPGSGLTTSDAPSA